jgi:hypothetical protein
MSIEILTKIRELPSGNQLCQQLPARGGTFAVL